MMHEGLFHAIPRSGKTASCNTLIRKDYLMSYIEQERLFHANTYRTGKIASCKTCCKKDCFIQ